jgi:hypothetical protein
MKVCHQALIIPGLFMEQICCIHNLVFSGTETQSSLEEQLKFCFVPQILKICKFGQMGNMLGCTMWSRTGVKILELGTHMDSTKAI